MLKQKHPNSTRSNRAIKWVIKSIDPLATVRSYHTLNGATSSTIYRISLCTKLEKKTFVLRQFDNKQWNTKEADLALHEASSLMIAAQNGLHVPQLIAYDETGKECGMPTVLMSYLEGEIILNPQNKIQWLNELAKTLLQIHSISAKNFMWKYYPYMDLSTFQVPSWSNFPKLWKAILSKQIQPNNIPKPCFIHRDYHPANVLWKLDKIYGVVDWVSACIGPAGIDIGHCRVNLAMLFDVATADEFLAAYKKLAGFTFSYDPYWDLISLVDILESPPKVYPGWKAFGIQGLTDQLIRDRIDQFLASIANLFTT